MTLSLSATDLRHLAVRRGFLYLAVTMLCAGFGAVYEYFSHGVYSYYMLYAFAFPLCGGVLPCFLWAHTRLHPPGLVAQRFYHAGIATWTIGSMVQGILEIYGTSNYLTQIYWYAGTLTTLTGFSLWAWDVIKMRLSQRR